MAQHGELKRISQSVKAEMQITGIDDQLMKSGAPALLFENVIRKLIPALIKAFESTKGVAMAHGAGTD